CYSQVRATNLQELVYKNGQAGVTKATVTITFDNSDKKQSPIGYEHYDEVTITRQVVIGGRNKYLINGTTVQNNRVQDFFRSVQLNVNNPHFLIMQGRITKVLNMKPPEILAMIEEAAGTRMYEAKKQQAQKTIEKKDAKLKEINDILSEEITPTLSKLKEERSQYLEYQKVQRELEHLTKLYVAFKFVQAEKLRTTAQTQHDEGKTDLAKLQQSIADGSRQVSELQDQIAQLQQIRDSETGGQLQELEKELKEKEKAEVRVAAALKSLRETIKAEEKKCKQLQKFLAEDEKALEQKRAEGNKVQGTYDAMRAAATVNTEAVAAAEARLQAISTGMYASQAGGEDATLQDQIIKAKAAITAAKTETKQAEMRLKHSREELKRKKVEMNQTEAAYKQDKGLLDRMEKEVKNLEGRRRALNNDVRNLQEKVDALLSRYPELNFKYQDPERNFDRSQVKGLVCKLMKLKDPSAATALQVTAGGKLYNVIVSTEVVGKQLLQRGQLQSRVTFIPLNKITARPIDQRTAARAQQIGGKDGVQTALSLVDYNPELQAAMEFVLGATFVCRDMDVAKRVAFDERILRKCVTLEGDVVDPAGTLSGDECIAIVERCKQQEQEGEHQVQELLGQIKNAKALKEQQLKEATKHLEACKKKELETRQQWDTMKQEEESLKLEVRELEESISAQQQQLQASADVLKQYAEQLTENEAQHKLSKDEVESALAAVKEQKQMLAAQNKEINAKLAQKDAILKAGNEAELEVKQLEHKLSKLKTDAKEAENKVASMLTSHEWIAEDRKFFGQPNTAYDFETNDPNEAGRKISKLEETKTKLSKNVNMRAMNMLGKAEDQYNDLMRKKQIVENDKAKIETVIRELDEKKKEALRQAWEQVNKDFGSIFCMLLPGTQAKLLPPEGMDVLDGLEVKVAFGDVWKESLTELSGGQRSLVALSLILALLLFKPAPIYILDEVDAALDLSHTQNIGHMLRTHFKHSQFIVVSLKDGMFNNANVLFKTKFVDGSSTVTRHTQQPSNMTRRK
ncbi:structural maintenance of chromosomes protein 2, partial [Hyalella azteca]|uniref:Structural maintenance of chromosomes protein 2 n=1 Tax=Hyalella azteca TaxID=294128 RepID=A0A8B7NGX7_HYAAZ